MKVVKKQTNSGTCFGCGKDNPIGLKTEFYEMEDNSLVGYVTLSPDYMSYPTTVHGGITATLLDETMGRAIFVHEPDTWGVTLEINVKYKKPVPFNVPLRIAARVTENKERVYLCESELLLEDNTIAAYGKGAYFKSITTGAADAGLTNMQTCLHENEPTEFDLPVPAPHPER